MTAAASPSYLAPYLAAAKKYGAGFGTLLWASPRTQAIRFNALLQSVDVSGKAVVDVGCGRADLMEFMLKNRVVPRSYLGIEAVEALAAAAETKHFPNTQIVRGDFLENPSILPTDADVLFYSGSLNTMSRDEFYNCLRRGFAVARSAVVFNFLATPDLASAPHLTWHRPDDVRAFAGTLSGQVTVKENYLPGDCTIAVFKDLNREH